jgi:hypothetical protein
VRLLLLLFLSGCAGYSAMYVPKPRPAERCIPVTVDGRPAGCVSPRELDVILRDGARI